LRRFQEIATSLNVETIVAVATSAVREAPNGREFAKIEDDLGLSVDLISGQEEARRIYLGVLSGMEFNSQPHIIIDIGGGSTELILGSHEPRSLSSTKGAVRLTAEYITTDPVSNAEFQYLRLTCAVWSVRLRSCGSLSAGRVPLVWWEPLALLNRWRRSTREKSWG